MAKLIKCTEDRPSNEFLVSAPCSVSKFDVVGEPGAWTVEIPDINEFAVTYALAFGDWKLVTPDKWFGNTILNFNGVTNFKFYSDNYTPTEEEQSVKMDAPTLNPIYDDVAELRKKLDDAGVKYHHFAKAPALRKLIEENGL